MRAIRQWVGGPVCDKTAPSSRVLLIWNTTWRLNPWQAGAGHHRCWGLNPLIPGAKCRPAKDYWHVLHQWIGTTPAEENQGGNWDRTSECSQMKLWQKEARESKDKQKNRHQAGPVAASTYRAEPTVQPLEKPAERWGTIAVYWSPNPKPNLVPKS